MQFDSDGTVATLHFDDGKANAIGHAFIDDIVLGLSRAQTEARAVLIVGRDGLLSGGFDLKVINEGGDAVRVMMTKAADMFYQLLTHPQPVVIACTGHAVAAGAFLLLSADTRIGSQGDFKIGLNETSIGSSFPEFGIQLATTRLNPAYLTRSFVQSELFSPPDAVQAGFLDGLEPRDLVVERAWLRAQKLSELPQKAYAQNKRDSRRMAISALGALQ
ncbi:MAG: crotonase/enoyl-CoA hydratase family protein [Pseudomonadales bacterium]|nr:crotonase/enoyl-CoA hydratase family protein [Pseudomonadales bacterium]